MAHSPTILIVDDDPAIRKMLVEVLSLEGYPTETATNGQEALAMLTTSGASRIVLLDLLMPVLDGRGMMMQLDDIPATRSQHKIVLMSAWTQLELARDLTVDGALPKPFTVVQLLSVLEPLAKTIA
jgi:CheY-like chemotaxis protein